MVIGVFERMRIENSDLVSTGKVKITQSSMWNDDNKYSGACIVNDDFDCFLCTKSEIVNPYVIIQIVDHPTSIQGIKLGSVRDNYVPLAWLLEGSNDNNFYEPIISVSECICDWFQNDNYYPCDGQFNKTYNIKKTKAYEYFKISQIGMSSAIYSQRSDINVYIYSLRLSTVEFYLMKPIEIPSATKHYSLSSIYIFIMILIIKF